MRSHVLRIRISLSQQRALSRIQRAMGLSAAAIVRGRSCIRLAVDADVPHPHRVIKVDSEWLSSFAGYVDRVGIPLNESTRDFNAFVKHGSYTRKAFEERHFDMCSALARAEAALLRECMQLKRMLSGPTLSIDILNSRTKGRYDRQLFVRVDNDELFRMDANAHALSMTRSLFIRNAMLCSHLSPESLGGEVRLVRSIDLLRLNAALDRVARNAKQAKSASARLMGSGQVDTSVFGTHACELEARVDSLIAAVAEWQGAIIGYMRSEGNRTKGMA